MREANTVKMYLLGTPCIIVNAQKILDANMLGVGSLHCYVNPTILNQRVLGLGKIAKSD